MSSDKFIPTPAGTRVPAPTAVQSFARRQNFPRAPITNASWAGGSEAQFSFRASGTECFVASQSRLVLKMHVRSNIAGAGAQIAGAVGAFDRPPAKSVRLAQDPVARAFSSARLAIGGVTVMNTGADLQDVATIIGRTQGTKAGGAAAGSAGMLGFDQRLTHPEAAVGDATALSYHSVATRNSKHTVLQDSGGLEFEVSTPLGNLIPFFMQDKTYLRDLDFDARFVVNSHFQTDMLVTAAIAAAARAQGLSVADAHVGAGGAGVAEADRTFAQLLPGIVAAGADSHVVTVTDCYIDACYAIPSAPLPPLRSMQIPFSDITLYTRPLVAGQANFTETFSGIPPSTSAIIVALRTDVHALAQNRELYSLGGSATGFKSLQITAGQFVAPTPSYQLNLPRRAASRAASDFYDFVGGSARDGAGGFSIDEWCDSPLLCFRLLQPKGTYSPTMTARLELLAGAAANTQLLVACVHSRVAEMYFEQGQMTSLNIDEVIA